MSNIDDLRGIQATKELQFLNITGNVIPHNWFKTIKMDNGAPDLHAIVILSEIVYWYKPVEKFNEKGIKVGITKKYESDLLQKSYTDLAEKFGTTKRQVRDAITRLEKRGIVERDFRTIMVRGVPHNNVLFIALNVDKLKEYTIDKEIIFEEEYAVTDSDNTLLPEIVTGGTNSGRTNTKITTKTTTYKKDISKSSNAKASKPKRIFSDDSYEMLMVNLFISEMQKNSTLFKEPSNKQQWCNHVRLIIDIDLKEKDADRNKRFTILKELVLHSCNKPYFYKNIRSIDKLRKRLGEVSDDLQETRTKQNKKPYNNYNTSQTQQNVQYNEPDTDTLYSGGDWE